MQVVTLWLVSSALDTGALRDACLDVLSVAESAHARSFGVDRAREQYVVARLLLRTVLSSMAPGVKPSTWDFDTNAHGKPHIIGPECGQHIRFNLSHTDGLVALAVCEGGEVGVDVENVQDDLDLSSLAAQVFSPMEREIFEHLKEPAKRQDYFYSIWTLKEAYVKAEGTGLAVSLDSFSFSLEGEASARIHLSGRASNSDTRWRFARFDPSLNYKLALAVPSAKPFDTYVRWTTVAALIGHFQASVTR
jgi:4'-phosphopantetheinyl transferase